jgi:fumarate reductase flavoprotein subunit
MQESLVQMLMDYGEKRGVKIYWETPAVRLVREGKGRVTGVIGRNAQGDYVQFNARKGVILCTGDYGNNPEMVKRYLRPAIQDLKVVYEPAVNTGDGHQMGLWIGADIDDVPHCGMIWDFAIFSHTGLFNLGRQPWLYVNADGERFMNEDLPYGYECNQMLLQPGGFGWAIWDAKYNDEWPKMQSQCCKNMGPPTFLWSPKQLEEALADGNVHTAGSISELAQKIQVPAESMERTTARYSELARQGKDIDFGKHSDRLTTLEKAPYYACKMEVRRMITLSGLKINTNMQVLDTERQPIPGLYAAGNVSGSFFGDSYASTVPGLTHSRAWTFGRLAGLNAAAEKVNGK